MSALRDADPDLPPIMGPRGPVRSLTDLDLGSPEHDWVLTPEQAEAWDRLVAEGPPEWVKEIRREIEEGGR